MGGLMSDSVQRVKERLDIVEVIGEYVRLRKAGKNYQGLCPFHSEKTPSFSVSQERQTYHCFGCNRGGDVISFVMEIEGLDFPSTLEMLAERVGVELPKHEKRETRTLTDVMEATLRWFRDRLRDREGEVARAYLKRRNFASPEILDRFSIGWAPSSWDGLWSFLQKNGVSSKDATDCGLVMQGKHGVYDRFRGRIIFPIRDGSGRLVAFGGRIIDGEGAKYINSPEGVLYSKRKTLYLLNDAKQSIREKKRTILVEGYMDALRLQTCGYSEAVASLGTSLTEEQAEQLHRLADRCLICYDADAAGQEATIRGMYILRKAGLSVSVVRIPLGKDPDELLQTPDGPSLFDAAVQNALPLVSYHIAMRRGELDSPETRKRATDDIIETLRSLGPVDAECHIAEAAKALGVFPHVLRSLLAASVPGRKESETDAMMAKGKSSGPKKTEAYPHMEAALCYMLWRDAARRRDCDPGRLLGLLSHETVRNVAEAILSGSSPQDLESQWLSMGEKVPLNVLALGGEASEAFGGCDGWNILLAELGRLRDKREYELLRESMQRGVATADGIKRFGELGAALKRTGRSN